MSHDPPFEPFSCSGPKEEHLPFDFHPVDHDLIVLDSKGNPKIARNASVGQMVSILRRSNDVYPNTSDAECDFNGSLIIIRFEENELPRDVPANLPKDLQSDWSELWPCFDCCCNDTGAQTLTTQLRQEDPHCESSVSHTEGTEGLQCQKISYSFNYDGRHILLAHHFHRTGDITRDFIRMVTHGVDEEKIRKVLRKSLQYLNTRPTQVDQGSPGVLKCYLRPSIPHPKAILCSMLESMEDYCRKSIAVNRREIIEKIEADINDQRDLETRKPKRLEISYVKLSEARIRLGEAKQRLQYLESSIYSLESVQGIPIFCQSSNLVRDGLSNDKISDGIALEDNGRQRWWPQLLEVMNRLSSLKVKCKQDNINVQTLQERVQGIISIVSILLAEQENEYSRHSDRESRRRAEFQIEMLKQQELIARRAKRDNSVMKVIAVLSAFFLPPTFIATLFSVPIFQWDQEQVIGPHFMMYWYFTVPITTTLVVGFSVWFMKMWYDDRRLEKGEEVINQDLEYKN